MLEYIKKVVASIRTEKAKEWTQDVGSQVLKQNKKL